VQQLLANSNINMPPLGRPPPSPFDLPPSGRSARSPFDVALGAPAPLCCTSRSRLHHLVVQNLLIPGLCILLSLERIASCMPYSNALFSYLKAHRSCQQWLAVAQSLPVGQQLQVLPAADETCSCTGLQVTLATAVTWSCETLLVVVNPF
jgi:hypothetical protein